MNVVSEIAVDKSSSHINWSGAPIALHSHHYHFQLQNTLRLTDYIDAGELTRNAASWAVKAMLHQRFGHDAKTEDVLAFASDLFLKMGFGKLHLAINHTAWDQASTSSSMYVDGWTPQWGYTEEKVGPCDFPAGFIAGALSVAYKKTLGVTESTCRANGADHCIFRVYEQNTPLVVAEYNTNPNEMSGPVIAPPPTTGATIKHNVNEAAIMDAVLGLPLHGDSDHGLAQKFGVMLNWTPQQYYSALQFGFITKLAEYNLGLERNAEHLLHFDGEACALNTFHGITRSEEWEALIKPMLQSPSDSHVALNAIMNCLGWGRAQIVRLKPDESIELNLYGGQEGLGYRSLYGISNKPRCYAFSGAVRALMEVFLPGNVIQSKFGRFGVQETQCVSMGAPHCSFVATRTNH